MAALRGVGFLIVEHLLEDVSFALFQPYVNTTVPAGGIAVGTQTVAVYDPSMYAGAQLAVGEIANNIEVVTISAVIVGVSFTATFVNTHLSGEPILGATFPIRQTSDPLFTQGEVIQYLSTAVNDLLTDCPLVYAVNDAITVSPSEQNTALPVDCMYPVRVAYQTATGFYPLRESSQSNLDSMNYRWSQAAMSSPRSYFRDKVPFQNIGIWPRQGNTTGLEIIYAQRQTTSELNLADGFLLPDPFLVGVLYKTLSYAYSKDGESRNPALARYFQQRYEFFVKLCRMFLESIQDPNLEMAQ